MENATDALKMAGWVLIFIIALSFSMNALTLVKGNIDTIVEETDREYLTKYVEGNKDSSGTLVTERLVGAEAIVPTIYRAFKDSRLRIEFNTELFKIGEKNSNKKSIKYIDNSELKISNDEEIQAFMQMLMSGSTNSSYYTENYFNNYKNIYFGTGFNYADEISGKQFKETTGIYYIQDVKNSDGRSQSDIPESQKTEKRIIKYTQN